MSCKVHRFKFKTSQKLKRIHRVMLNNFAVHNVKCIKNSVMYFTVDNIEDLPAISTFFSERGVEIESVR